MVPAVFGGMTNLEIMPMLFEITGSFIHEPNPLVESNLDMLKAEDRARAKPDLGVCFDGDADRCMFLDENGKTIGCDLVTALLAARLPQAAGEQGGDDRLRPAVEPRGGRRGQGRGRRAAARPRGACVYQEDDGRDQGRVRRRTVRALLLPRQLFRRLAARSPSPGCCRCCRRRTSRSAQVMSRSTRTPTAARSISRSKTRTARSASWPTPIRKAQIDYLDGITDRPGRLVVQRPQEQHRAAAASQPRSRERRQCCDEKLEELKKYLGEPVEGH